MGVDLIDGKPAGHSSSQARPLFGNSQKSALRQGTEIRQVNVLGHETTTNVTKSNWSFKLRHEDKGVNASLKIYLGSETVLANKQYSFVVAIENRGDGL